MLNTDFSTEINIFLIHKVIKNNFGSIKRISIFVNTLKKIELMANETLINELKKLSIDELGDILIEIGGFRNAQVDKEQVENDNGIELYYDEYKGVEYVDVFLFPRKNNELIW
jgi:hypothetical protein